MNIDIHQNAYKKLKADYSDADDNAIYAIIGNMYKYWEYDMTQIIMDKIKGKWYNDYDYVSEIEEYRNNNNFKQFIDFIKNEKNLGINQLTKEFFYYGGLQEATGIEVEMLSKHLQYKHEYTNKVKEIMQNK